MSALPAFFRSFSAFGKLYTTAAESELVGIRFEAPSIPPSRFLVPNRDILYRGRTKMRNKTECDRNSAGVQDSNGTVAFGLMAMVLLLTIFPATAGTQPSGLRIVSPSNKTTQLSQYGITWYFEEEVAYGQFITGDYWVVGPVEITEIEPRFDGTNGTMVNPSSGGQGYDNRFAYSRDLTVQPPFAANAGSSIVSTRRRDDDNRDPPRPVLAAAAVLTVLPEAPPHDSFRPPLVGESKTIYTWSQVRTDLLPKLSPVDQTPSVENYIPNLTRPWILHVSGWGGRYFHPAENMPGDYHREIGRFLSEASVLLMMDVPGVEDLLLRYLQVGIDYFGVTQNTEGTSSQWQWPVVFTGIMLDDVQMKSIYRDGHRAPENSTRSQRQLYRLPADNLSPVESSIVDGGADMVTWTGETAAWRQDTAPADCYHQEHLHPSEWSTVSRNRNCSQSLFTRETYRRINSPAYVGFAAAAGAMDAQGTGARGLFDRSELFFDYAERWMREDLQVAGHSHDAYVDPPYHFDQAKEYASSMSEFVDNFWHMYYSK